MSERTHLFSLFCIVFPLLLAAGCVLLLLCLLVFKMCDESSVFCI